VLQAVIASGEIVISDSVIYANGANEIWQGISGCNKDMVNQKSYPFGIA